MAQNIFTQNQMANFNERRADAVAKMFIMYYPVVLGRVRQLIPECTYPEDLVSEVFERMLKPDTEFDRLSNLQNYLFLVTISVCTDDKRKRASREPKKYVISEFHSRIEIHNEEQAIMASVYEQLVYLSIESLPAQCREVFKLNYLSNLKNREIAVRMGLTVKTVENQITLAHHRIRMEVERRGGIEQFMPALLLWLLNAEFLLQNIFYENI